MVYGLSATIPKIHTPNQFSLLRVDPQVKLLTLAVMMFKNPAVVRVMKHWNIPIEVENLSEHMEEKNRWLSSSGGELIAMIEILQCVSISYAPKM